MRKTTLWSSLGAAVLLAASSFSASAQYSVKFLSPSPDVTEVTSEEMNKIVFQYWAESTNAVKTIWNFNTDITAFENGVTLVDENNVSYPLQAYTLVNNSGQVKTGNSSQTLLTASDKNQIAVSFGELGPGTYTLKVATKIVQMSYPIGTNIDAAGEHTWTIAGGSVTPVNPFDVYEFDPVSGSTIVKNDEADLLIGVSFPDVTDDKLTGRSPDTSWDQVTLSDGTNTYSPHIGNISVDGNYVTLRFAQADIQAGTYTLEVPAGFWMSQNGNTTPAISGNFVIEAPAVNPWETYTFDPESGSTITVSATERMEIKLSFPEAGESKLQGANDGTVASQITLSDGINTFNPINRGSLQGDFKSILYSFDTEGMVSGTYELTVPAGFYKTSDGQPTPAISGTFVLVAPEVNPLEVYALDPASGTRVDAPRVEWQPYNFTVSFPEIGDNTLEAIEDAAFENIYLTNGTENFNAYYGGMNSDSKSFYVMFYSNYYGCPAIPGGKYTLVVPEGFCKTANGALSPEIRGEYTFVAPLPEFEGQDPAWNAENPSISEMRLNYSAAVEFKADAAPMAVLNDETDADTGMTATFSALENEGKTVVIKFSETDLEEGEYYFIVPDGAIYAAGDPEAALAQETFTFLIKAPAMPAYDGQYPGPEDGVQTLSELSVFFTEPVAIGEGKSTEFLIANETIYNEQEKFVVVGKANATLSEDGKTAVFAITPDEGIEALEPAQYMFVIPAGTFVAASDNSYELPKTQVHFTIAAPPVNPMTLFTVDPADNSELTEISDVYFDFYELDPKDGANFKDTAVRLKNLETGEEWGAAVASTYDYNNWKVQIKDLTTSSPVTVTAPGHYELTFPAGSFEDWAHKENLSEEIVLHYTIPEPAKNPFDTYTITPDGSSDVSNIGTVSLVFNNIMLGTVVDMNKETEVKLVNKTTGTEYIPKSVGFFEIPGVFTDYANVKIIFDPAVTELGEYTLTVGAGLCSLDGFESAEITRNFNIAEIPSVFRDWTITPGNGEEVKSIDKFVLTFPYATESVDQSYGDITLTLKGSETVITPTSCAIVYDQEKGEDVIGQYEITFEPAVTEAGTYVLNIPADKFLDFKNPAEQCSPEISVEVTIAANPFGTYTLTPASMEEGLKEVSTVEVLFPAISAEQTVTYDEADVEKIGMRNVDNDQVISAIAIEQADTDNGKLLTIRFAKAATDAKHILTIPAGILKLGEDSNFMIEAIYDIEASGVALLVGENGTADVYDLNGRVILLNADADALRQLEGGLYIINGKKVVIRK